MNNPIIKYPRKQSEFEMQANLFQRLKKEGFDIRGEVFSRYIEAHCTFDLVIFMAGHAAIIIEVKNSDHADLGEVWKSNHPMALTH